MNEILQFSIFVSILVSLFYSLFLCQNLYLLLYSGFSIYFSIKIEILNDWDCTQPGRVMKTRPGTI